MRILILGVTGMLGHVLFEEFQNDFDVFGTIRQNKEDLTESNSLFNCNSKNIVDNVDALDENSVDVVIRKINPDFIINCIGIIKQIREANDQILSIKINSLFPNMLANICRKNDCHLIHISTDCVFSGKKGMYIENDLPDADDLYGRTKLLGEVNGENCLTIRTSLIGREISKKVGLLEWFLAQSGPIRGFRKAIFSGLTTYAFSNILKCIIKEFPKLNGIYHIASKSINKFELLSRLKDIYEKKIEIIPDDSLEINRSLDPSKFIKKTDIKTPSWDDMLLDLKEREK